MSKKVIEVYPSKINIHNYTSTKYSTILNKLRYWDDIYFKYNMDLYLMNEDDNILTIPGGFSEIELEALYKNHKFIYRNGHPYKRADIDLLFDPRDSIQKNAINFLMDNKEQKQLFLCLKTGHGKTYSAINYITKLKRIPLIIVDSNKLLLQWREEFTKFTNLKEDDIYLISGSSSIENLLKDSNDINPKAYIASIRTLSSYISNGNNLDTVFKELGIGIKVFDEAHVNLKAMADIDMLTNVDKTLYLTATPERSSKQENTIYQNTYGNILQYGIEKKYTKPYHNIVYVKWDSKPDLAQKSQMVNKNYGFDINGYTSYIENTKLAQIIQLLEPLLKPIVNTTNSGKVAIVVQKNSLIKKLYKELVALYPDKSIGIFSSIISDKNKRTKELDKDIILTTLKSFNKGVDVKDLTFLINFVPISSTALIEQLVGRLRYIPGKKVIYYDIIDTGFDQYKYQLASRKKVLDAISINNLEIDLRI